MPAILCVTVSATHKNVSAFNLNVTYRVPSKLCFQTRSRVRFWSCFKQA